MTNKQNVGTITFANYSQLALFTVELDGQISDGMWENTQPNEHFVFWHSLDHKVGPNVGVTTNEHYRSWDRTRCMKNNYDFMSKKLLECVGDRMLAFGRMGLIAPTDDMQMFKQICRAAEYLPNTFEQYEALCKVIVAPGSYEHYRLTQVQLIPVETVQRFYATSYTEKDLHSDLRQIKKICKTVPAHR